MFALKYRRMAIEQESPEQLGYGKIRHNLTETSVRDRNLKDLGLVLEDLLLPYGDHLGDPRLRELLALQSGMPHPDRVLVTPGAAGALFLVATARTLTTCSPGSWADRLLEAAGAENLASDARPLSPGSAVASFGDERLLGLGNRLRLILVQQGAMNATPATELARDPRLASLEAVRAKRVRDVPEAFVSRPSLLRLPRALALLEALVDGAREGRTAP